MENSFIKLFLTICNDSLRRLDRPLIVLLLRRNSSKSRKLLIIPDIQKMFPYEIAVFQILDFRDCEWYSIS